MKKLKTLLLLLCVCIFAFALTSCGKPDLPDEDDVKDALVGEKYLDKKDKDYEIKIDSAELDDGNESASVKATVVYDYDPVEYTREFKLKFKLKDKKNSKWKIKKVEAKDEELKLAKGIDDDEAEELIKDFGSIYVEGSSFYTDDIDKLKQKGDSDLDDEEMTDTRTYEVSAGGTWYQVEGKMTVTFRYYFHDGSGYWYVEEIDAGDLEIYYVDVDPEPTVTPTPEPDGAEGKVLNIYAFNEEFKGKFENYYPGYVSTDYYSGKIGDVTVNWIIKPNDDNVYNDTVLGKFEANGADQSWSVNDDKIDLFITEIDYIKQYTEPGYAATLSSIGIKASDYADQYDYTIEAASDSSGEVRGLSWQCTPGVLIYNRAIAKEVFGSDDAATVQAKVKDWGTYKETAKTLASKGYKMTATVYDSYRVYSNNVTGRWVNGTTVTVDPMLKQWADDSKELYEAKAITSTEALWSNAWSSGFYPEGKVFCYFGPAWLINFCMYEYDTTSIAYSGGWNVCKGPQSFFWGGTWLCPANGTDNPELVKDIILTMTTNDDVLYNLAYYDFDFVNDSYIMSNVANASSGFENPYLGGINPNGIFLDAADEITATTVTAYDGYLNERFQTRMVDYIEGKTTYDNALAAFESDIKSKGFTLSK